MAFRFPRRDEPLRISALLLIAASYFVVGQLALLLAIPPIYTTIIWPPAGIALGCLLLWGSRYWVGVLLGALLTHLAASYTGASHDTLLRSLTLAALLSVGATLQAVIGAKLIRRFVEFPTSLTRERDVFGFFVIGGPVTHLINATWATATLFVASAIPAAALAANWWTLWLGDTLGALIFTPLIVMWFNDDVAWASRRTVVTVPLFAIFFAALALFAYTSHSERQQLEQRFTEDASNLSTAIGKRINLDIDTLQMVSALLAADPSSDSAIQRTIGPELFARHSEIQAIEWVPAASPEIIPRAQTASSRDALVLAVPVYALKNANAAEQPPLLRGHVLATVVLSQLITTALRDQALAATIKLRIDDMTGSEPPITAYRSPTVAESHNPTVLARVLNFSREFSLPVANRTWHLFFTPTLDYVAARQTANAELLLVGGVLFAVLIDASALLVTGRAQAIETLVSRRTEELGQINEKLADEICDHLTTEHTLEQERELLRTVVNNLYEGILVLDSAGQLRMANGVAYRLFYKITGEDLTDLPQPNSFRMFAPDGTTELLLEQTPQYCALRGQTVSDFEMVVQAPGHAALTLIVNAQPLLTSDQQRHGAIIVMRDITDSKAVERMKAEFVATVSHELRTPITSIRGSLGLIAGGVTGPVSEQTRNLVAIALRNSDRLAHLINDLLDMEKMESGKMIFDMHGQPITALIEQAIENNSGYAENLGIHFALTTPVPAIAVLADAFRLLQVMSNLLSNAAKFSPAASTVEITVVERIATNGARLARVQVTDCGPGIADEFRSRIFQKFSQADSSDTRAKSGTGLGLAICKAIIEQMGGTIGYESEVGVGSTFYFELPQASNTPSDAANRAD